MQRFRRANLARACWVVGLGVVAFVALFGVASAFVGFEDTLAHIAQAPADIIVALLGLSLLNYGARALRWRMFSNALGVNVAWGRSELYFIAGFALTTTPGKIGEALRMWLLDRGHGYRWSRTAPLLLADRLGDVNSMLLTAAVGLLAFPDYLWITAIAAVVALAATALSMRPDLSRRLVDAAWLRVRRRPRLFAGARRAMNHLQRLFTPSLYAASLALGVAGWLAEMYGLQLILAAFGEDITYLQAVFVFAFAMIVGGASMVPGGLGGAEATMAGMLIALGVDPGAAVAATAIVRAATLWFGVALGAIALPIAIRLTSRGPQPL